MKIYFDMDGVLADYDRGVRENNVDIQRDYDEQWANQFPANFENYSDAKKKKFYLENPGLQVARNEFVKAKNSVTLQPGFFLNLDLMPGAVRLVNSAIRIFGVQPIVLSTPVDIKESPEFRENCVKEKTQWIGKNFPGVFTELIFEPKKDKYASRDSVLIDDNKKNTVPFLKAGGFSILYTGDVASAIEEMRQISSSVVNESTLRRYVYEVIDETSKRKSRKA